MFLFACSDAIKFNTHSEAYKYYSLQEPGTVPDALRMH
jgi:hypothetical protein